MPKTFSKSMAIFCAVQIIAFAFALFAKAGPLPKTDSEPTQTSTTNENETEDDRRLIVSEELAKRLSPEGLKAWKEIDQLTEKFSSASEKSPNKTNLQQQIDAQLKQLSDDDVRTVLEVTGNAKVAKTPSPEIKAFSEAIKLLSPEGKRVMLATLFSAGLDNKELAETTIRQLGEGDRQTLMQAVVEGTAKSPKSTPEQKAFMGAIRKMSPEGKRLMFSTVFLREFDKNDDAAAKAKFDQLSSADLQILKNVMMAVGGAKARSD